MFPRQSGMGIVSGATQNDGINLRISSNVTIDRSKDICETFWHFNKVTE